MAGKDALRISKDEIANSFATGEWGNQFPPILTVDQAAELLSIPKATLYAWRSQGKLKGCCQKLGKHLRFYRDRLVQTVLNEGI
ncbi:MAG TPA: helix-turn-helix domain-containing protein [Planctomicrobium sp.]|nr:helix-turn-helix domain-containing protein [Planctomicrobium sp.]